MGKRQATLEALAALGIPYEMDEHEAVYTIDDIESRNIFDKGQGCKDLYCKGYFGYRDTYYNTQPACLRHIRAFAGGGDAIPRKQNTS